MSVKQLQARAAAVCERAAARTSRIALPASPAGAERFLSRGIAALALEQRALQRMRAPSSDAQSFQTAVRILGQILSALRSALHALEHGQDPVATIQSLQRRLSPLEARMNAAWRDLGVPACASG